MSRLVSLDDILAAREVIAGVLRETPLEYSRALEGRCGSPVYLKCENLQRTGSFKIRGAYVRISRLSDEERAHGVVAASAGNHAQGVALAASMLGATARVFMPTSAPLPKLAATRAYGAEIELVGANLGESLVAAQEYADATGAIFIHPFDHPDLIAGQGTCGLEIVEQCPDVGTVVVSTGGGGIVSGIAAAIKGRKPEATVVAVQAAGAAAFPASIEAGHPVKLGAMATMADGIAVPEPAQITFDNVRQYVDEVLTVDEDSISQALLLCLERAKLVVEPAGAAAVAALMQYPEHFDGPVVALLSGGNVDPVLQMRVVQHGMIAAGRYLSIRVDVADAPGSLAGLLATVAEEGANVLDVAHSRVGSGLHLGDVEVFLRLETKGADHQDTVMAALRASGFGVRVVS